MDDLVVERLFSGIYENKTVLVTGHTGFKGSWLSYWLKRLGANVVGFSLSVPTNPSHSELLNLNINSVIGDIRKLPELDSTFSKYKPDIVFHLAAQPIVRYSYDNPIETYETNVMGTLNVFECCKKHNIKAIVNITSDKAYENKEWVWGYRETDPMGGFDPYSSSKGCAELLSASYRSSFFNVKDYGRKHETLLATCRAGNVIGGGDWARNRLMTDIMLSVSENKKVKIRNPKATRPWQHVLEPLSGYLLIGQKLLEKNVDISGSWNFGPIDDCTANVEQVVNYVKKYWNQIDYEIKSDSNVHEANLLKLDCSKANYFLSWHPVWNSNTTFQKTVEWYKAYYQNNKILSKANLNSYITDAKKSGLCWTN